MHLKSLLPAMACVTLLLPLGCGSAEGDAFPDGYDPALADFSDEYGKPLLDPEPNAGKADSLDGPTTIRQANVPASSAVWEVRRDWEDIEGEAGMAWSANSGLNWDQKFSAWVSSMQKTGAHESYYQTFELTTPWGKVMPAPALECAETSIFLRATFASWYNLPFFMAGGSPPNRLVFGHFGALKSDGSNFGPSYKSKYKDYSDRGAAAVSDWPSDRYLRTKRLGGSQDDDQPFLGEDAHAGAYFDEIFLNKRTGHFMLLLLSYFGSVNLASTTNTYNLVPEAIRPGDTLLERWQRRGIGHTLVVKRADRIEGDRIEAELISGSMPRRQGKWDDAAASKRYFTNQYMGGSDMSSDGVTYAQLGGGLKRWRVARQRNGSWTNVVMRGDAPYFIAEGDFERLGQRVEEFETLLGEVPPEQKRDALLRIVEDMRNHLRKYPASCSARIRREEAFTELYDLMQSKFRMNAAEVDESYRILEDYAFAELVYESSKTCCWNSTTGAMHEIVMLYNEQQQADARVAGQCVEPTVFKERDGDYLLFAEYAASIGRGDEWVAWSEDEPCAQRGTQEGLEATHQATAWCSLPQSGGGGGGGACADTFDGNASRLDAADVSSGTFGDLQICGGTSDWFVVSTTGTVTASIAFTHAQGDLDLKLYDANGSSLDSSTSTGNSETVSGSDASGKVYVEVFGYNGAENGYSLTISL
ncbi:MAG: PPC domain-containing protein [Deltaproteobacteria bacterium]|nr:PPC domain-containing protein [Deltaproteobacteria bacterium]